MPVREVFLVSLFLTLASCSDGDAVLKKNNSPEFLSAVTITSSFDDNKNYKLREIIGLEVYSDQSGIPIRFEYDDIDSKKFDFLISKKCIEAEEVAVNLYKAATIKMGISIDNLDSSVSVSCLSIK